MSLRLKAASLAAIIISAVASLVATDPSLASGAADSAGTVAMASRTLSSTDAVSAMQDTAPQSPVSIVHNADGSVTVTPRILDDTDMDSDASSLAELVKQQDVSGTLDSEMQCLASAVYFESKGEPLAGQLAVARVVINRSESSRFPDSLCGVIYQRSQFSFVRGGRMPAINTSSKAWHRAVAIAKIALDNSWTNEAKGALYFHARRVSPGWRRTKLVAIDNHIFYR
ncbi:cell wall hydrolase [Rhizorhapis sp. SPR117]|uniref:cell wall hydrolase n=1 Tax=Rhizorhapis sp. SPR117 TaxID=2912611 RepID=UPI001F491E69|nr:cell wall hydrolase [Rhizorhapis sp. SPR117]